jgi:hypothetical protein
MITCLMHNPSAPDFLHGGEGDPWVKAVCLQPHFVGRRIMNFIHTRYCFVGSLRVASSVTSTQTRNTKHKTQNSKHQTYDVTTGEIEKMKDQKNILEAPYKNLNLSAEERTKDLLSRMTLEEKAAQMVGVWNQKADTLVDEKGNFDIAKARDFF